MLRNAASFGTERRENAPTGGDGLEIHCCSGDTIWSLYVNCGSFAGTIGMRKDHAAATRLDPADWNDFEDRLRRHGAVHIAAAVDAVLEALMASSCSEAIPDAALERFKEGLRVYWQSALSGQPAQVN